MAPVLDVAVDIKKGEIILRACDVSTKSLNGWISLTGAWAHFVFNASMRLLAKEEISIWSHQGIMKVSRRARFHSVQIHRVFHFFREGCLRVGIFFLAGKPRNVISQHTLRSWSQLNVRQEKSFERHLDWRQLTFSPQLNMRKFYKKKTLFIGVGGINAETSRKQKVWLFRLKASTFDSYTGSFLEKGSMANTSYTAWIYKRLITAFKFLCNWFIIAESKMSKAAWIRSPWR